MREINIGEKVWWAKCENKHVEIDCPICFGKKEVTLILGNDEKIKTDCDYCVSGFEPPKGFTMEYQRVSGVEEVVVTGKEVVENEQGRKVEYRYHNYCLYPQDNIFDTKEEAENRVSELIKEHEQYEADRNIHRIKSNQSKYSWKIGYYKKRLKDAQREIEIYSNKITNLPPRDNINK
jgi:hypothetical protein